MKAPLQRILIIRHGALGDIALSFASFAGIRQAHPDTEISLLTTAPFAAWLSQAPWFNEVLIDAKPAPWNVPGVLRLRKQLVGHDLVVDLQTSRRSSYYFRLAGSPPWSGIARGCLYRHTNPRRDSMHTRERLADQLSTVAIVPQPPNLSWLRSEFSMSLPQRFIALVPGAAPHRPKKRWPAQKFAALAAALKMRSVILGTAHEQRLACEILRYAPDSVDLTGRTTLADVSEVLARATLAIGNDTGLMHLATAFNVPSIVLFGPDSDPKLTAPRYPDGHWPTVIRAQNLADLPVDRVVAANSGRHKHSSLTI